MNRCPVVAIPFRGSTEPKRRLSALLPTSQQRQQLVDAMLRDMLSVLDKCSVIAQILLVTDRPAMGQLKNSVTILPDPGKGLNAAVDVAAQWCLQRKIQQLLVLHADLPLLAPSELDLLIGNCDNTSASKNCVTVFPDRHSRGTNALLCSPPDAIAFGFGPDSRRRHCQNARAAGCLLEVVDLPGVAHDIDTPDDLQLFLHSPQHRMAIYTTEVLSRQGFCD